MGLSETDIPLVFLEYSQLYDQKRSIDEKLHHIEHSISKFLDENGWDEYTDPDTKITVRFVPDKKMVINQKMLKFVLKPSDYDIVVSVEPVKTLMVMSEDRKRNINKYVQKKLGRNANKLHP